MSSATNQPKLFLLTRGELLILSMISILLISIGFTLGVHLGKQLGSQMEASKIAKTTRIQTLDDQVPTRQELQEQSQGAQTLIQDVLQKTLYDEVTKSGLRLKTPRSVELPKESVSSNAGATNSKNE
jgi:hypothetical protein